MKVNYKAVLICAWFSALTCPRIAKGDDIEALLALFFPSTADKGIAETKANVDKVNDAWSADELVDTDAFRQLVTGDPDAGAAAEQVAAIRAEQVKARLRQNALLSRLVSFFSKVAGSGNVKRPDQVAYYERVKGLSLQYFHWRDDCREKFKDVIPPQLHEEMEKVTFSVMTAWGQAIDFTQGADKLCDEFTEKAVEDFGIGAWRLFRDRLLDPEKKEPPWQDRMKKEIASSRRAYWEKWTAAGESLMMRTTELKHAERNEIMATRTALQSPQT